MFESLLRFFAPHALVAWASSSLDGYTRLRAEFMELCGIDKVNFNMLDIRRLNRVHRQEWVKAPPRRPHYRRLRPLVNHPQVIGDPPGDFRNTGRVLGTERMSTCTILAHRVGSQGRK
jgi:hypothetical protein